MLIATMFATHSAQSLEQSLAAARLTRFVHRNVSANLEYFGKHCNANDH